MSGGPLFLLAAFATGLVVPVQLALNAQLGQSLRSPWLGAFFVFAVGLAAMAAVLLATRTALPTPARLAEVPPLAWGGGIIATVYILAIVLLVPRLGVGAVAVAIIAGQIVGALVLDSLGAFGAPVVTLSAARVAGGLAVVCGALLVRLG
jgi:transporter family-2 protein